MTEACAPRARALQRRVAAARHNQRKPACSSEDPIQPKNKLINLIKLLKKKNPKVFLKNKNFVAKKKNAQLS